MQLGSCAVGVKTAEGVVLGVEKRISSSLQEHHLVEKIVEIDTHCGAAISGLNADGRSLVDHARVEAQNHRFTYAEPLRVESLAQSICDQAIAFGEDSDERGGEERKMSRPYGVSLLLAGAGPEGPRLICTDPSGTYVLFDAHAIGSGGDGARSILAEKFHRGMSLADATALVTSVLRSTMEEKITKDNVEIAVVSPARGFHVLPEDEIERLIAAAAAAAADEAAH
jgi:20S proteasome subunit alpha 5